MTQKDSYTANFQTLKTANLNWMIMIARRCDNKMTKSTAHSYDLIEICPKELFAEFLFEELFSFRYSL